MSLLTEDNSGFWIDKYGIMGFLIENDTVTNLGLVPEKDFIDAVDSFKPFNTGILPRNCIFYTQKDDIQTYVLEYFPQIVPIHVKYYVDYDEDYEEDTFQIGLPYVIIIVSVRTNSREPYIYSSRIFSSKSRIRSLDDKLYKMPLPNMDSGGHVCWGSSFNRSDKKKPILEQVESVYSRFLDSQFNNDLGINYRGGHYSDVVEILEEMNTFTKEDPNFLINRQGMLNDANRTIGQCI